MCRYAYKDYKAHYACFDCRKTYKRKNMEDINGKKESEKEARCPQCGQLMANMGLDFAAPKMDDVKAWAHIQGLYTVGITFHSCGCSGPGYIPEDNDALREHFLSQRNWYEENLKFWRGHEEPSTEPEVQRDWSKHGEFLAQIPVELRKKRMPPSNQDAIAYWIDRVKDVNARIRLIR